MFIIRRFSRIGRGENHVENYKIPGKNYVYNQEIFSDRARGKSCRELKDFRKIIAPEIKKIIKNFDGLQINLKTVEKLNFFHEK